MTSSEHPPVLLVGCGRMGGALLHAWRRSGRRLFVLDPSLQALDGVELLADVTEIRDLPRPLIVVLAVKPNLVETVARDIAQHGDQSDTVISIAAGIGLQSLKRALAPITSIVRAMPNTGVAAGAGATALVAAPGASVTVLEACEALFAAAGLVVRLEHEALMDAATAVSGSGPAFFFAFAEALARAGEAQGLPSATAEALARQTLVGAGALAGLRPETLAALREEVTSPGGTTAAGLEQLWAGHSLGRLAGATVAAAADRSRALGAPKPALEPTDR